MKRKVVAIMITTAMVFSLAACGSDSSESTSAGSVPASEATEKETTSKAETETEAKAESSGGNVLTAWVMDDNSVYSMETAAKIYKETHPDFEMTVINQNAGDLEIQVTTAGASGDYSTLPDIIQFQDYSYTKFVENYPDLFLDLTNSEINFSEFGTAKVDSSVVNGKNYGVPFENGVAVSGYRTDFLEKAGYTVDDFTDITWDQFITIGEDVKAKTGLPLLTAVSG